MFFREVVGQEKIKERLIRSVQESRVPHAQLFTGPQGVGKLPLALAYAQYVSCPNRTDKDSCGTCPSCRKYQKLIHPDLHFVFPVFKKESNKYPVSDDFLSPWRSFVLKSPYFTLSQWLAFIGVENAQGLIYEKESESILRKLNLKPFESESKIMIIWLPEKMHPHCANKVLKMIEEPPSKTLFLMITENEEEILGTIRSRAQCLMIPPIDDRSLSQALEKKTGKESVRIDEVVRLANGSYLTALENLNPEEQNQSSFLQFQELMRAAYTLDIRRLMAWSEEMAKTGREKQKKFLQYALRLVRDYFVFNLKNDQLVYLNPVEEEWGKKFSPFINERNILWMASEFERAYKHIALNGNPRIIFMDIALRMVKMIKK
jgi:DNA polymerase III subunit delta'